MEKIIAICGLECTKCEAFLATQKNNGEERKKVAKKTWKRSGKISKRPW